MTEESRLQNTVRERFVRAASRTARCIEAAIRTLPMAGLLLALAMVFPARPAQAQTPATAWGFMSGSQDVNANDQGFSPGGRSGAATWADLNGNLWLFGGYGYDSAGNLGYLNDLWEYSIANNLWTIESANATLTVPSGGGLCNAGVYTAGSYVVGGRAFAAAWTDTSGNFWLFGGQGCGSGSTTPDKLNDLWMYNVATGQWAFEGGGQTTDQDGVYGEQFVSSNTFLPGSRYGATAWTGADGTFWLFGGIGLDSNDSLGDLDDLWKLNPTTLEWTWVSGGLNSGQVGIYGTFGQPDADNVPGSRYYASGTVDASGNLWLFGGQGCDTNCFSTGDLNDLWLFNPTTLEWTWESGTQNLGVGGNAGTEFVAAVSNDPGARYESNLWADAAGNLWLFGGQGFDTGDNPGDLNDLWEFDATTKEWTFMGGSPTATGAQTPAYGTEGTPDPTNIPGGRNSYAAWNTLDGNLWLFGGNGYGDNTTPPPPITLGELNDLWEAVPPTPTPAFSLVAGTYQGSQTLTIGDAVAGAAIYFTTNGNTPVVSSSDQYNGTPITVSNSEFVQAIAVAAGHSQSLPRQVQYVIEPETAINWQNPAPIAYGTPLSSVQLDASTSIPGSFVYTPDAGTVLTAGAHALSVTFTPSDPGAAGFQAATATVTLQVSQATPTITWPTPAPIAHGTGLSATQLDASASFNGASVAGAYVYSPAAGTVLAAGTHTLNVTFTPTDATDFTTATGSVTISVTQDTPVLTWAAPAAIAYGTPLSATQLDASAAYDGNPVPGTFVYSPAAGAILPVGTQTLNVTFTPTDTTDYATVQASTTIVVNSTSPSVSWPTPAAIVYGTPLGSAQLDATASVPGTFVYAPTAGTVLSAGAHTLNVTFTPTDATTYAPVQVSVTLAVNQATPTIIWPTPAAIAYGTALGNTQLDATATFNGATVAGTYAYSPAAGAILTAGAHVLTVTFTPTDTIDFTTATGTVTIDVAQDTPTIAWALPGAIAYGTPLTPAQLDATATFAGAPVAGTFIYSPAPGTILPAGTQALSVTFTPTDSGDYSNAMATTTIVVNQATPILTWQAPAAIDSGTPLSSAQLDATASVPGTFVYAPAAGTVLAAGAQTLSVTFTPSDAADYATATANVTITVLSSSFTIGGSPGGQTVYAGYSTDFIVTVAPVNGPFNNAVTLSVTGLPSGATASFAQPTLTPGASPVSTALTIFVPAGTASNRRPASPFGGASRTLAPLMALLLLLPFRKARKAARRISLLLILAVSLGVMLSLSACGSPASNVVQHQAPYVLTLTGTSGTSTQTAQIVLTVE